jgi:hypothetical protein
VQLAQQRLRSEAGSDNSAVVLFVGSEPSISSVQSIINDQETKTPVHVIAAPGADWRTQERLQRLTASTGGMAYFPTSDKQFREVSSEAGRRLAARVDSQSPSVPATKSSSQGAKQIGKALSGYDRLVVQNIPVADGPKTAQFEGGDNLLLQQVITERIQRAHLFPEVINGRELEGRPKDANVDPARTIELRARVTEYERGSRVKRQFTFSGAAKYRVQVLMVDGASGQIVHTFETGGQGYGGGVFGGSDETVHAKAMLQVANKIIEELKKQR